MDLSGRHNPCNLLSYVELVMIRVKFHALCFLMFVGKYNATFDPRRLIMSRFRSLSLFQIMKFSNLDA